MPGEIPPTFTLSFEEASRIQRPLVYVRRRLSDGRALYIGSSTDGLSRPLQKVHEKAHLAEGEVLEVYLTDNPREVEARMILDEQPELNYNGPNSPLQASVNSARRCPVCEKSLSHHHGRAIFCSSACQKAAREAPKKVTALQGEVWGLRVRVEQEAAARAPLELALLALAGRAEALVEQERAMLEGRRAILAELEGALQEAQETLAGRKGPAA